VVVAVVVVVLEVAVPELKVLCAAMVVATVVLVAKALASMDSAFSVIAVTT